MTTAYTYTHTHPHICIVPAKGTSRRLPYKNLSLVAGKPLLAWTLSTLKASNCFTQIYVSSEAQEVLDVAIAEGVTALERPAYLSSDTARIVDVVSHCLPVLALPSPSSTWVSICLPTACLLAVEDMRGCVQLSRDTNDPVMTVIRVPYHPTWLLERKGGESLHPVFPVRAEEYRADIQMYVDSGGLYTFPPGVFQTYKSFYPPMLRGFEVSRMRGVDVNEPTDLELVKVLFEARFRAKKEKSVGGQA